MFFSINLIMFLQPYLESKERKRISGIRGNLIRYKYISKEQSNNMNDQAILLKANKLEGFSHSDSIGSRLAIARKGKETKERKQRKGNKEKEISIEPEFMESNHSSNPFQTPQRKYADEYEILKTFWNSLNLPECRYTALNLPNWGEIMNSMQHYNLSEIEKSIDNYKQLRSRKTAISYSTFPNFLVRGIEKYADSSIPFDNFKESEDEKIDAYRKEAMIQSGEFEE